MLHVCLGRRASKAEPDGRLTMDTIEFFPRIFAPNTSERELSYNRRQDLLRTATKADHLDVRLMIWYSAGVVFQSNWRELRSAEVPINLRCRTYEKNKKEEGEEDRLDSRERRRSSIEQICQAFEVISQDK